MRVWGLIIGRAYIFLVGRGLLKGRLNGLKCTLAPAGLSRFTNSTVQERGGGTTIPASISLKYQFPPYFYWHPPLRAFFIAKCWVCFSYLSHSTPPWESPFHILSTPFSPRFPPPVSLSPCTHLSSREP